MLFFGNFALAPAAFFAAGDLFLTGDWPDDARKLSKH